MTEEIHRARWWVELLRKDIVETVRDTLRHEFVSKELEALLIAERRATLKFSRLYREQQRRRRR